MSKSTLIDTERRMDRSEHGLASNLALARVIRTSSVSPLVFLLLFLGSSLQPILTFENVKYPFFPSLPSSLSPKSPTPQTPNPPRAPDPGPQTHDPRPKTPKPQNLNPSCGDEPRLPVQRRQPAAGDVQRTNARKLAKVLRSSPPLRHGRPSAPSLPPSPRIDIVTKLKGGSKKPNCHMV